MPCRDGREDEWTAAQAAELQMLTNMLCRMCAIFERRGLPLPQDLADWWTRHQKADAERLAREQEERDRLALRAKLIVRLTPAERRALGL